MDGYYSITYVQGDVALWPNFMSDDSAVFNVSWEDGILVLAESVDDFSWNARLERIR